MFLHRAATRRICQHLRFVAAIVLVVFAGTGLRADQTTGAVRVTIGQTEIDRASVEITSAAEPSRRWMVQAAGPETATVHGLPPAVYHVVVTFAGGATGTIDVSVGAGEIVSIGGAGLPATAGQPPLRVIDRTRLAQGTYFSGTRLRDFPAASSLVGLLDAAAPFVIVDRFDEGGLGLGTTARVGSRGASWTSTSTTLGEFEVAKGPRATDQLAYVPDLSMMEAVSVESGLASPDVAAPGATVTLVPRRPGPVRQGAFDASFTAPGMVSSNGLPGVPSIAAVDTWRSADLSFGGPIAPNAGVFVAGSASALSAHVRDEPNLADASVSSVLAHLVANPSEGNQARVLATAEHVGRPLWGANPFRTVDLREQDAFVNAQAGWDHQGADGSRLELSVAAQRGRFTPSAPLPPGATVDRVLDGVVPSPPADDTTSRSEVRAVFAPVGIRGHGLEAGLSFARAASASTLLLPASIAELVYGTPARVWTPIMPSAASSRHAIHVAAYLTDHFAAGPNLTVDLGLRLARSSGSAAGAAQSIAWGSAQPRMSFRWATQAATLFGGYGRYQAELPLDLLAFGDPGEPAINVYRWNDANANGQLDAGETGTLVMRAGRGPSVASISPTLSAPHTDEFVLGAERSLGPHMRLSASAIVRREHDLVQVANVGVSASDYHVISVPDQGEDYDSSSDDRPLLIYDRLPASLGLDRFLLTNSTDRAAYSGIEVGWSFTSPRWWSFAGASAYRTDGSGGNPGFRSDENDQGVAGELLENPNAASYADGRLFFDRAYVLKWSTGYHAPHDIRAAVAARYQDGQPFSRLVIAQGLTQGPEVVSAYHAGRTRFTFTGTIDARIEKGFALAGRRASLRLELFNLANLGYEVEENPVTGATFRDTTAVQPPRTLRLGFHLEF